MEYPKRFLEIWNVRKRPNFKKNYFRSDWYYQKFIKGKMTEIKDMYNAQYYIMMRKTKKSAFDAYNYFVNKFGFI